MPDLELTLAELSARVGIPGRTIRDYQRRGLIPPPSLRGRLGIYGRLHVERLEIILDLRRQGLTLASITALISRNADLSTALAEMHERSDRFPVDGEELLTIDPGVLTELRASDGNALGVLEELGLIVNRGNDYAASAVVMLYLRELIRLGVRNTAMQQLLTSVRTLSTTINRSTATRNGEDREQARRLTLALIERALASRG